MFTGTSSHGGALMTAIVGLIGATVVQAGAATADPDQDQKFLTLLSDNEIPAIDNDEGLIETAHKACGKLDDGMPVGDLVELMRNNGFATNPLVRLYPQGRVTRTLDRFIFSAVQAYCPYDQGKIASILAGTATGSKPGAAYAHGGVNAPAVWRHTAATAWLVSVIGPIPSGEVPPSNPPSAPAQPPPPPPQQVQQVPEPPPTRRYVPPAPQRPQPPPQQVEPPPPEAGPAPQQVEPPPPEAGPAPQQAEPPPPEPPPPPPEPPPAPPHAPGFVRLAP